MHAAKEALWLQSFVNEMRGEKDEPLRLNCDNQGARALAKDNKFHSQTKHIDLQFHFIREAVEDNKLLITYVPTEENMADIFTKALARPKFEGFVERLGLREVKGSEEGTTMKWVKEEVNFKLHRSLLSNHALPSIINSMWQSCADTKRYNYLNHVSLKGECWNNQVLTHLLFDLGLIIYLT